VFFIGEDFSFEVQRFKGSEVLRFYGSKVLRFMGLKVQRFRGFTAKSAKFQRKVRKALR